MLISSTLEFIDTMIQIKIISYLSLSCYIDSEC